MCDDKSLYIVYYKENIKTIKGPIFKFESEYNLKSGLGENWEVK